MKHSRTISTAIVSGILGLSVCILSEMAATAQPAKPELGSVTGADLPDNVRSVVLSAQPTMIISEAELKERQGRRYYDVEGKLPDGSEIELDLLETPAGWEVVEIQRDLAWSAVPGTVSAAADKARAGFTPVRVIESKQAQDGSVIYELFADGHPKEPALEVRVLDGKTEVLKEAWPH
jgi:hypothetical protein